LPTDIWGSQFPLVQFANIRNQEYQIVANTNGTIVNVSTNQYRLNAGHYQIIRANDAEILTSNYPIQLIQIGQV